MSQSSFTIDATNSEAVKTYISRQFASRSWWPAEQPHIAKEEFERLGDNPENLSAWCEKWLDGGQWRLLASAIRD